MQQTVDILQQARILVDEASRRNLTSPRGVPRAARVPATRPLHPVAAAYTYCSRSKGVLLTTTPSRLPQETLSSSCGATCAREIGAPLLSLPAAAPRRRVCPSRLSSHAHSAGALPKPCSSLS
eukprot:scaffold49068_cov45-Phaeocystis_antarctica.AAC.2